MASIDAVNLTILLGALLVFAGILSSLVAMRFGAPLLLIFLLIGMLAGEAGPGGIKFDDVQAAYTVGAVALALILFDGGLRTRFQTFRSVLGPAGLLATVGVLITAALVGAGRQVRARPRAGSKRCWSAPSSRRPTRRRCSSCCIPAACGCARASARRWRSSPAPTIRSRSSSTIVLVEILVLGDTGWQAIVTEPRRARRVLGPVRRHRRRRRDRVRAQPAGAAARAACAVRRRPARWWCSALAEVGARLRLPRRLSWPASSSATGPTRAHNTVVVFLDAVTWLAQIAMFVILGLLVWPERLPSTLLPALARRR